MIISRPMKAKSSAPRREEVLAELAAFLKDSGENYGLAAIGCFGSVARGEADSSSDVDVVYRTLPGAKLTLFDLVAIRDQLMERLGFPVDLIELREGLPDYLVKRLEQEAAYV